MLDPVGLGAVGELIGSSWINQIWSGLGVDNSLAAQTDRQGGLASFANFATLGLANDAATVSSGIYSRLAGGSGIGYDLNGGAATPREQLAAGVQLFLAFMPGEDVEAA